MKKRAFLIYFVSAFKHICYFIKVWYIVLYRFLTMMVMIDE